MLIIIVFLSILLLPSFAEAWGPLTHVYLGNQVLELGASIIPAGIYGILKKYKSDFLYGNLSADIIFGRRFQGLDKGSHENMLELLNNGDKSEVLKEHPLGIYLKAS